METANSESFSPRIYPNVELGENVIIDDFCTIGYPPHGKAPGELKTKIGDNTHIRSHTIIYAGVELGANCHVGHGAFIRELTTVGEGSSIGTHALIEHHVKIGKRVRIQGKTGIPEYTIIEDEAWIGPFVAMTNVCHPVCQRSKDCLAGPLIRKGAIIGAQSTIFPGLEIGERSFIGAGSVVTKSVPDKVIVVGNPAKPHGEVTDVPCKYDLVKTPDPWTKEVAPQPRIPLVDLNAQYQQHKNALRVAIDRVILNTRFVNGREVGELEEAFARFCGVEHCVCASNGTSALFLALTALGIGPGHEVITTPHTFIATAEAILGTGARPVFVDIDERTFNIDPAKIEAAITPRTAAIMPVHLYGRSAAMEEIAEIARRHDLPLVGDAAQAHGATLHGRGIASWAKVSCYSFFPGKNFGAFGDGGAIVTDDAELARKVRMLRDHGRREKYMHEIVGWNMRLDTLQAAVLLAKLPHLARWNELRREHAAAYRAGLEGSPLLLPEDPADGDHVYHQFVIRHARRDELRAHLDANAVASGIHFPIPLHLQPALAELGHAEGDFPVTEAVAKDVLSLPMFPELTEEQRGRVIASVLAFFEKHPQDPDGVLSTTVQAP